MERNINALKFSIESPPLTAAQARFRCTTCGEEFGTPLLAMISSGLLVEEYYACPKCLSKVGIVEHQKNECHAHEEGKETLEMEVKKSMQENIACAHHLGYLKQRPKNTPIPEECLTCSKMIDCLSL